MNKIIITAAAMLGLTLNAFATTDVNEYIARYAGRTDIPRPVQVVAPSPKSFEYGKVTLAFVVSPSGEVRQLEVVDRTGSVHPQTVVSAVKAWKFQPRQNQAVDVPVALTVNVNSGSF